MSVEVFTDEWARECREHINTHEGYRRAAARWEDAIVLVMTADAAQGVRSERAYHLDLYHGTCRKVRQAVDDDFESAPFVLSADPAAWRLVLTREMDPIAALVRGKLHLQRGSLLKLTLNAGAAKQLVEAAAEVDAHFPAPAA